jgi:hypothetical protein
MGKAPQLSEAASEEPQLPSEDPVGRLRQILSGQGLHITG